MVLRAAAGAGPVGVAARHDQAPAQPQQLPPGGDGARSANGGGTVGHDHHVERAGGRRIRLAGHDHLGRTQRPKEVGGPGPPHL